MESNLAISYVLVSDLIPYARNARKHSEKQVAQIAASIKEFGFITPVLLADDKTIIAGHGRILAARKLEMDNVPCVFLSHLSPTQRKAYGIVDNQLSINSSWDEQLLGLEIKDLEIDGFDLSILAIPEKKEKKSGSKKDIVCPICGHEFTLE